MDTKEAYKKSQTLAKRFYRRYAFLVPYMDCGDFAQEAITSYLKYGKKAYMWGGMLDAVRVGSPLARTHWKKAGAENIPKHVPLDYAPEIEGPDGTDKKVLVSQLLDRLASDKRMQKVIHDYYVLGKHDPEIAKTMGLTASRICQIRLKALSKLRRSCGDEFRRLRSKNLDAVDKK